MASEEQRVNARLERTNLEAISDKLSQIKRFMMEYQYLAESRESEDGAAGEIYDLYDDLNTLVNKTLQEFNDGHIDEYDPPK